MFAEGMDARQVAVALEVSTKSGYAWRRAWVGGGVAALVSRGARGPARRLTEARVARLEAWLLAGPVAAGYGEDQRWTLVRVARLVGTMFHRRLSLRATSVLLHRVGWSARVPVCRAVERDQVAIARWWRYRWPSARRVARRLGAHICVEDECGLTLRPAKARTWAPRGKTPVVTVAGRAGRKVSVAGLVCHRPRGRGRLMFRLMVHHGRKGEPKGFREPDFAGLLDAAHQQLGTPIVLVWDGLPGHRSAAMRRLVATRSWLRVYPLPGYAPECNPAENVWSNLRRGLANLAAGTVADLARVTTNRLKRMQYRPGLVDGFLAATGLSPP
jgi:transposase